SRATRKRPRRAGGAGEPSRRTVAARGRGPDLCCVSRRQECRRVASALRLAGPLLEDCAMTVITPSDTQARAIARIKEWFKNETSRKQIFRLFGYAGTGKSTVLKFALAELGLEPHKSEREGGECVPGVVTATFT